MIILLPLLRKLSVDTRARLGVLLAVVGLVAIAAGLAAAPAIVIPAVVTVAVGAIFLGSARRERNRDSAVAR